jgi:hypothetical protein
MRDHSAWVVDGFFLVAWVFPSAIAIGYCRHVVPHRVAEIIDTFFGGGLAPPAWLKAKGDLQQHPAALYLSGNKPADEKSLEQAIRAHVDRCQAFRAYVWPLLGVILISACGLWLCRVWVHEHWFLTPNPGKFPNTMSEAVVMALAGAYVWGIWETLDRAQHGNLTPDDLVSLSFRWVVCIPVGYACSLIAGENFKAAFAFAASVFPLKDVRQITRQFAMKKLVPGSTPTPSAQQSCRESVEGISDTMAARLEELSIFTALDMAYANPIHLMVKTGVPIREVLDWMDQAIFAVYVSTHRPVFVGLGMRCSIDICEFAQDHGALGDPELDKLATELQMTPRLARDFISRITEDPQVRHLYDLWYRDGRPTHPG